MKKKYKKASASDRKRSLNRQKQQRRQAQSKQELDEMAEQLQKQWDAFRTGKQPTPLNGVSLAKYIKIADAKYVDIKRPASYLLHSCRFESCKMPLLSKKSVEQ